MRPHINEPAFHKSSHGPNESAYVEVAEGIETMVRDTQNRELGTLGFGGTEWAAALSAIRTDQV
ncbi:DUF397 domain-containing protein [Nocardiopsis sp. NPDC006938]|uniref:DUF397 domain-containing protein n=1 Tax=Nocardiopsis sp. NPDC006938 TaxID=3364337 RepID=UPI0036BA1A4C